VEKQSKPQVTIKETQEAKKRERSPVSDGPPAKKQKPTKKQNLDVTFFFDLFFVSFFFF